MNARSAADTHRAVAALYDAHPDLPPAYVTVYSHTPHAADVNWYLTIGKHKDGDQRAIARSIVSTIGGTWDKDLDGEQARFTQARDGLKFTVLVAREQVCTRRVVGTETVTMPAVEAVPERTVERDVVEWDCGSLLAETEVPA